MMIVIVIVIVIVLGMYELLQYSRVVWLRRFYPLVCQAETNELDILVSTRLYEYWVPVVMVMVMGLSKYVYLISCSVRVLDIMFFGWYDMVCIL